MSHSIPGRRLLLVHAHPDDESIWTGATMAACAASGVAVTLVTCTLGELGEVIPPELADLTADACDRLGPYRARELAAACAELGVADHRILGGPGRWRDSGMMGLPSNEDPACFWQAGVDEAAAELAPVIRETRPQVVITYDEFGFYGHPDHIQAHRVTRRAISLAAAGGGGVPGWQVPKLYATAMPRSALASAIKLSGNGDAALKFRQVRSPDELPYGVPDEQVTTEVDGTAHLPAKLAAMGAHASQIALESGCFALTDMVGQRVQGREYYTLLAGPRGPAGPRGYEQGLFHGV